MKNSSLNLFLTNQLLDKSSIESLDGVVYLDPIRLYEWCDWTEFDQKPDVLNQVYGMLFDEVVIDRKKIHCFWPLENSTSQNWFELLNLSSLPQVKIETKSFGFKASTGHGLNSRLLTIWEEFIATLVGTLVEDLSLNQQFDDLGTLSSANRSFVLFRAMEDETSKFGFAVLNTYHTNETEAQDSNELSSYLPPLYESFDELLHALSEVEDLIELIPDFHDKTWEKKFFKIVLRENKPLNLIQKWLSNYSLN